MHLPFLKPRPLADAGKLYAAIIAETRRPNWYREAGIPDTMDGRFAVLTSLLALADIRLKRGADEARRSGRGWPKPSSPTWTPRCARPASATRRSASKCE